MVSTEASQQFLTFLYWLCSVCVGFSLTFSHWEENMNGMWFYIEDRPSLLFQVSQYVPRISKVENYWFDSPHEPGFSPQLSFSELKTCWKSSSLCCCEESSTKTMFYSVWFSFLVIMLRCKTWELPHSSWTVSSRMELWCEELHWRRFAFKTCYPWAEAEGASKVLATQRKICVQLVYPLLSWGSQWKACIEKSRVMDYSSV